MPRLSYVHGASDTPFIGDTIGGHFDRIAERFADRDALVVRHQQIRWTYRELKERVDAFAAGLLALGSSAATASACGRPTTPNG
jgi:fatty-acyl-CoA synthase